MMKQYKVNEIFYSLQGEGMHTGMAATFVRFSGCNLRCEFCDTKHNEGKMMTAQEIVAECIKNTANIVVLTGGEPTLQVDEELLIEFHKHNRYVCMETNGTREIPAGVDFVTVSPKFEFCKYAELAVDTCNELKVVYDGNNDMSKYSTMKCYRRYLQPCDTGVPEENKGIIEKTIAYIKEHPQWTLSLQTQKITNIR